MNATLGACLAQSIVFDVPKIGRWVTIQNGGSLNLQLTELEVFGYYSAPGRVISEKRNYMGTLLNTESPWSCVRLLKHVPTKRAATSLYKATTWTNVEGPESFACHQ